MSNIGNVPYCTITTTSESPVTPGVIWIGTDDGRVHVTRDHGAGWEDLTKLIAAAGGPADRYVSRVFASPHDPATAFVAKNGFRNDDFRPFLFRTNDSGRTWTSISAGLPDSPINVVVQDPRNAELLIVGNDLGVWISIDRGSSWTRLKGNLPTVPVHDLTVHPRENDLVLGTYGRGVFVGDITHLQELTPEVAAKAFHLFDVEARPAYQFRALGNYHLFGDAFLEVPNEPEALQITYFLAEASGSGAQIVIEDPVTGDRIAELKGPAGAGVNRVPWNMRRGGGRGGGPLLEPGTYRITVSVGSQRQSTLGRIRERIR